MNSTVFRVFKAIFRMRICIAESTVSVHVLRVSDLYQNKIVYEIVYVLLNTLNFQIKIMTVKEFYYFSYVQGKAIFRIRSTILLIILISDTCYLLYPLVS